MEKGDAGSGCQGAEPRGLPDRNQRHRSARSFYAPAARATASACCAVTFSHPCAV